MVIKIKGRVGYTIIDFEIELPKGLSDAIILAVTPYFVVKDNPDWHVTPEVGKEIEGNEHN